MPAGGPRLVLLVRPGCGLCDHMLEALHVLGRRVTLPAVEVLDVDTDPVLERRYGLEIPVLLVDDVPASRVELDTEALLRLLRRRF